MRNNRYEAVEVAKLREILVAGDRLLELGAGIGLLSSVAAQVEGIEAVTSVEANPELIPVIEETFRLNGIGNVDLRNGVVVAGSRKRAPFYLRGDFWASSTVPESRPFKKKKHIKCFSIRDLIEEKNPTVIVCDIEGGEIDLFDDADLSRVRALIIEFHPRVYGAETVETITRDIEAKGLTLQKSEKSSAVRIFQWEVFQPPVSAKTLPATPPGATPEPVSRKNVKPDLPRLQNKPWDPKTARFLITTCMKDEGPFIVEWLAWHKSIGIQDIVVFTNDCTDGTDDLLDHLEEMGQLRHLPNPALASGSSYFLPLALTYTSHLKEFKRTDFYIPMDVDEFINIGVGNGQMSDLLAATGEFDALSISELNHGSNLKEHYERGLLIDLFPQHQRKAPGRYRAHRGVKTIVRRGDKLKQIRNHRPDLRDNAGPVVWLDGSGRPLEALHADPTNNGIDVRGSYDLVVLDHFALRSLNSYLVKMFRGDAVIKDKMVSQRYWRLRDRNREVTSTFERQKDGFMNVYNTLMKDQKLADLHEACCVAHEDRISKLLTGDVFLQRKQWIFDNIWFPKEADK